MDVENVGRRVVHDTKTSMKNEIVAGPAWDSVWQGVSFRLLPSIMRRKNRVVQKLTRTNPDVQGE
jgi:hypothetical protein